MGQIAQQAVQTTHPRRVAAGKSQKGGDSADRVP